MIFIVVVVVAVVVIDWIRAVLTGSGAGAAKQHDLRSKMLNKNRALNSRFSWLGKKTQKYYETPPKKKKTKRKKTKTTKKKWKNGKKRNKTK